MRRPVLSAFAVAVAISTTTACAEPPADNPAVTERIFLETCAPGRTPVEEQVCRCAFEAITADLSPSALERLDRNLRDDPETVPAEVAAAALDCAAVPLTPPTVAVPSSTTAKPEDETTTTEAEEDDEPPSDDETTTTEADN